MRTIGSESAIELARNAASVDASTPARAWYTHRLDRSDLDYYLVEFGEVDAVVAVAAINASTGELLTWARLPGRGRHLMTKAEAVERTGWSEFARADLVWRECRATRSLLYPLWEIRRPSETLYVDQTGVVSASLAPAGPGG